MEEGKKKETRQEIITDEIDRPRMGTDKFIEPFPVREVKDLTPVKSEGLPAKAVSQNELYGKLPPERMGAARVWNKVRPKAKGSSTESIKAKKDSHTRGG